MSEYVTLEEAALAIHTNIDIISDYRKKEGIASQVRRIVSEGALLFNLNDLLYLQTLDIKLGGRIDISDRPVAPISFARRDNKIDSMRREIIIGGATALAGAVLGGIVNLPSELMHDQILAKKSDKVAKVKASLLFDDLFGHASGNWSVDLGKNYDHGGPHLDHSAALHAILLDRIPKKQVNSVFYVKSPYRLPLRDHHLLDGASFFRGA